MSFISVLYWQLYRLKIHSRHGRNITEVASILCTHPTRMRPKKLNSYGQLSQTVAVFCPSTSGAEGLDLMVGSWNAKGCQERLLEEHIQVNENKLSHTWSAWAHNVSPGVKVCYSSILLHYYCLFNGKWTVNRHAKSNKKLKKNIHCAN